MPTLHLSLPEKLYRELKEEAEELGIQITDLAKILIREGLDRRREKKRKLQSVDDRIELLEGELMRIRETIDVIYRRLEEVTEMVREEYAVEPEPEPVLVRAPRSKSKY